MATNLGTNRQVPENAILDYFQKQLYLGNQFIYTAATTSAGTTEVPILLISNPAVASTAFPSGYLSHFNNRRKVTCTTATQSVILRFYISPTVTSAGTAVTTVLNARPQATTTPVTVLTSAPSVSANGTLMMALSSSAFNPDLSDFRFVLDPGKAMLVTSQSTATSTVALTELAWYEL